MPHIPKCRTHRHLLIHQLQGQPTSTNGATKKLDSCITRTLCTANRRWDGHKAHEYRESSCRDPSQCVCGWRSRHRGQDFSLPEALVVIFTEQVGAHQKLRQLEDVLNQTLKVFSRSGGRRLKQRKKTTIQATKPTATKKMVK